METANSFEEFLEILKQYEIETYSKFVVFKNPKGFLDKTRGISSKVKVHWKEGLPYFHLGKRVYICHQGKDKSKNTKKKYMEKKEDQVKNGTTFRTYVRGTKKLGCPASISVTRVYSLPQFKLEDPTRKRKDLVSVQIKKTLKSKTLFEVEEAFWYSLPPVDAHMNHAQGEMAGKTEPVDPAVKLKLKELVEKGERNAYVLSELLETYVTTNLQQFDKSRRRFFPDIAAIKTTVKNVRTGNVRRVGDQTEKRKTKKVKVETSETHGMKVPLNEAERRKQMDECNSQIIQSEDMEVSACLQLSMEVADDSNESERVASAIKKCNSQLRKLRTVMRRLPERELLELENDLKCLNDKMKGRLSQGNRTYL